MQTTYLESTKITTFRHKYSERDSQFQRIEEYNPASFLTLP